MLASAELTLLGILPLIRIVEDAQEAETPVDLVLEIIFGQIERYCREPVQVLPQPVQGLMYASYAERSVAGCCGHMLGL